MTKATPIDIGNDESVINSLKIALSLASMMRQLFLCTAVELNAVIEKLYLYGAWKKVAPKLGNNKFHLKKELLIVEVVDRLWLITGMMVIMVMMMMIIMYVIKIEGKRMVGGRLPAHLRY